MGLAPAYPVLLVGGLLTGIGASVLGLVFAAAATRHTGDGRRVALSRVQSIQTSGSILGAPVLTAIAAAFSWRWGYAVVLVAYLAAIALIARALPTDPRPSGRFTLSVTLAAYRPLLGDRQMLALYAANALRQLGWTGPFLYLGAFYTERHGLTLQFVGLAYMIASAGMLAGNAAAGRWLAGRNLHRAFAATVALLALAWVAVFAVPLPTPLVVVAAALAAFASGFSWIAMTTLLATETPAGLGTTMALNNTAVSIGAAAGGAAVGFLIGLGGYALLGGVLLVPTLIAAALTWNQRLRVPRAAPAQELR
jgi:predicted MFS family arabinose efflux permease